MNADWFWRNGFNENSRLAIGLRNAENGAMEVYIYRAGETFGPYDELSVRRYISEGELSLDDLAWRDGFSEWVSLKGGFAQIRYHSYRLQGKNLTVRMAT
jgi:hypothetical protein